MPSALRRSAWPMPDSSSSCGEAMAPVETITSRAARASRFCAVHGVAHADAARALEDQALGERAGLDRQVRPDAGGLEIAARRAHAPALVDGALRHGDAFLIGTVVVAIVLDADGLGRLDEAVVELAALRVVGDLERALAAADLAVAAGVALHALEDRQHVLVAPAAISQLRPMVEVLALAAHPHHAVDGAGAAEHASARHRDRASAGDGLGLGGIQPVDARPGDEPGEADRHARQRMRLAAGLEQQHLVASVLGQAIGERRPCRARTHDDEIDRMLVHAFPHFHFSCSLDYQGSALRGASLPKRTMKLRHSTRLSSRCLSPGSIVPRALTTEDGWIPGTRPGMTTPIPSAAGRSRAAPRAGRLGRRRRAGLPRTDDRSAGRRWAARRRAGSAGSASAGPGS